MRGALGRYLEVPLKTAKWAMGMQSDRTGGILRRLVIYLACFAAFLFVADRLLAVGMANARARQERLAGEDLLEHGYVTSDGTVVVANLATDVYWPTKTTCLEGARRVVLDPTKVDLYRVAEGSWLGEQRLGATCTPVSTAELASRMLFLDPYREHDIGAGSVDPNVKDAPLTHHYVGFMNIVRANEALLDKFPDINFVSPKHYKFSPRALEWEENTSTAGASGATSSWTPAKGFNHCITTIRLRVNVPSPSAGQGHASARTVPEVRDDDDANEVFDATDDTHPDADTDTDTRTMPRAQASTHVYITLVNPVLAEDLMGDADNDVVVVDFVPGDIYHPWTVDVRAPGTSMVLAVSSADQPGETITQNVIGDYDQVLVRTAVKALRGQITGPSPMWPQKHREWDQ